METRSKIQPPTHPVYESRAKSAFFALAALFLSVSLLFSLFAAWIFIPVANAPAICVFHNKPWWISLTEGCALILVPVSIIFGIVAVRSLKQGYRGFLLSAGILNAVLGALLTLSLLLAEFLYFVCQL
jgi:hypothetical protein